MNGPEVPNNHLRSGCLPRWPNLFASASARGSNQIIDISRRLLPRHPTGARVNRRASTGTFAVRSRVACERIGRSGTDRRTRTRRRYRETRPAAWLSICAHFNRDITPVASVAEATLMPLCIAKELLSHCPKRVKNVVLGALADVCCSPESDRNSDLPSGRYESNWSAPSLEISKSKTACDFDGPS